MRLFCTFLAPPYYLQHAWKTRSAIEVLVFVSRRRKERVTERVSVHNVHADPGVGLALITDSPPLRWHMFMSLLHLCFFPRRSYPPPPPKRVSPAMLLLYLILVVFGGPATAQMTAGAVSDMFVCSGPKTVTYTWGGGIPPYTV